MLKKLKDKIEKFESTWTTSETNLNLQTDMLDQKIFRLYSDDEQKGLQSSSEEEKFDPDQPVSNSPNKMFEQDSQARNVIKSIEFQELFSLNNFRKMK